LGVRTRSKKHTGQANGADGAEEILAGWVDSDEPTEPGTDDVERSGDADENTAKNGDTERFREAFDANPELKRAWDEAQAYREAFSTPEEATSATKMLRDFEAVDALFFSGRAEDHAELAKLVARLDPASFASLAEAMSKFAGEGKSAKERGVEPGSAGGPTSSSAGDGGQGAVPTSAGAEALARGQQHLFEQVNAQAVKGVVQAIESQVDRLLPENISSAARNRVVGEIYRELDKSLQSNGEYAKQVRSALRSGNLDAGHQSAVVSLVVGRARQALPSVAKRVLNEWTSTILAANQDRRTKQRSAESRVEIGGSRGGSDGPRVRSPRDIDYGRLSDADILNM
jgi:hypothetical protein